MISDLKSIRNDNGNLQCERESESIRVLKLNARICERNNCNLSMIDSIIIHCSFTIMIIKVQTAFPYLRFLINLITRFVCLPFRHVTGLAQCIQNQ